MIKKYLTKPEEVEALEWTGENLEAIEKFVEDSCTITLYGELRLQTRVIDEYSYSYIAIGQYIVKYSDGHLRTMYKNMIEEELEEKVIKTYRLKPREILSMEWTGENLAEMQSFLGTYCTVDSEGKLHMWRLFNE